MPIEPTMKKLYMFIKNYGETHRVKIENLRLWARQSNISAQEMGYALQLLKQHNLVAWKGQKMGWIVMPMR